MVIRTSYKGYTIETQTIDSRKPGSPWAIYSASYVVKKMGKPAPLARCSVQSLFHTAQFAVRAGTDAAKHAIDDLVNEEQVPVARQAEDQES